MGSFSYLTIGDYPILSVKNDFSSSVIEHVFQPEDFIVEKRKRSSMNVLYWGEVKDRGSYNFKGFRQTVRVCMDRLKIYGMSMQESKKNFDLAKRFAAEQGEYSFPIHKISFKKYIEEIKYILNNKLTLEKLDRDTLRDVLMNDELFIDGLGIAHGLYLVLSCLQPDEIVEYDFSWIINGGWVKDEVPLIDVEKIIVLTEGKTDAEFISKSVQMLYPHLHAYYHFIDFDGFKVEGNASALVKMIKAFAASNVKHPIIAIFDNDTAGLSEMNNLLRINLPNNIKVIKLPDIPLAKKYPTIGPTGVKVQNVNGLACGIEMYLGKEILLYDNAFTPIRWRDYKDSLGQYHGVLDRKDEVQNKFREMVKQNEKWDMAEMRILLNEMFGAFTN